MTRRYNLLKCILLMIFACLVASLPRLACASAIYTIPIEYSPPLIDHPQLKLLFGKAKAITVALDTGCSVPLILRDSALAEILRANGIHRGEVLERDSEATEVKIACEVSAVSRAREKLVDLGGNFGCWVPQANVNVGGYNSGLPGLDGVAGMSLFSHDSHRHNFVQLDLAHQVIRVSKTLMPVLGLDATIVDMRQAPNAPGDCQIKWAIGSAPGLESCWLIIDTGSPVTIIPMKMAHFLHLREGVSREIVCGAIEKKHVVAPIGLASEFRIAGRYGHVLVEKNLLIQWSDRTSPVLGLDFLARCVVTLDPDHGKVLLERIRDLPRKYSLSPGISGITVTKRDGLLRVARIDKRLLMTDQPVQIGDELRVIDGLDTSNLTEEAQAQIDGYSGTVGFLRVRRSSQHPDSYISLLRRSPFDIGRPDIVATWFLSPHGVFLKNQTQAVVRFTNGVEMPFYYVGK